MLAATVVLLVVLTLLLFGRHALAEFSWARLEKLAGDRPALLARVFARNEAVAVGLRAAFWVTVTVLVFLALWRPGGGVEFLDWRLVVAWLAFLSFEFFVTRPLAEAAAERFILAAWPALEIVAFVGAPFVRLQAASERRLHRWFGRDDEPQTAIQEELISVVNEGLREGAIKLENAEEMIEGLIDLNNLRVAEIMTPRTEMTALRAADSIEDARRLICDQNHSRMPVYGDSKDEIVGILFAKDLLPHLASGATPERQLATLALRQPIYVPESQPVDVLLKDFQRAHMHMAIVLDEFGGVAGLVTMEDILEEVVGEIGDEYDERETPEFLQESESVWSVSGRARIPDLNAELSIELPESPDYETLAGYLFHTLGRVPAVGDEFRRDDAVLTVTGVHKRAVDRVRIELPAPAPAETSAAV